MNPSSPAKTICFINPTGNVTGAGVSLFNLLCLLRRISSYRIEVILPVQGPLAEKFIEAHFPVHVVKMPMVWEIPNYDYTALGSLYYLATIKLRNWFGFRFSRETARALASIKPDLVHVNDLPLQSAAITAHRLGIPVVWHVRHTLHKPWSRVQAKMIKNVKKIAKVVIGISDDEIVHFDRSKMDVRVICNPAFEEGRRMPEAEDVLRIRRGFQVQESDVLAYAPIHATRSKGIGVLLQAFKKLKDGGHSNIKLLVTGAVQPPKSRLKRVGKEFLMRDTPKKIGRFITKNQLENVVFMEPFVKDVVPYMAACDVLIFPTMFRAIGRPVIEAGFMEKPAIVTLDAQRDGLVLHQRTGLIVKDNEPGALALAILDLANSREKRIEMGRNAKRHLEQLCSAPVVLRQIKEVYDSILNKGIEAG